MLCLAFSQIHRADVPLAGGKGANLGDMANAGLPVPPGFVITSTAYRQVYEQSGLRDEIKKLLNAVNRSDSQALQEAERKIRARFETVSIGQELRDEILEQYHRLGKDAPVAVRSSATAEDMGCASFAGQQSTYLNIYGDENLLSHVVKCWSSLFTSQAIYYRFCNGFDDDLVSMAVVVQKMVNAEKAGVIFTVDPISRNPYQMIVEGVYGLGEGIVSGAITPDHYKVDRENYEVRFKFIAPKTMMMVKDSACGIMEIPVPEECRCQPVLSETELTKLIDMANKIEAHFGCPQDIEWGAERGEFYLLQSRPITTLG
ncbi:MAG: PEP/pyruvate-binding domain-containing protein [Chloroflexota bacterium]